MQKKSVIKFLAVSALTLLVVFCFWVNVSEQSRRRTILDRYNPERNITLTEPANQDKSIPAVEPLAPELRVAIAPIFSPEVSRRLYGEIVACLGRKLNMHAVIVQRNTYAEINELLRDKICPVAFVCSFPFVRGEKDFGLELLAIPQIEGQTTYQALIIVSRMNPARSLLDLKGQRFAAADIFPARAGFIRPAGWCSTGKILNPFSPPWLSPKVMTVLWRPSPTDTRMEPASTVSCLTK
jgi:ABC-type phosphate/phosphonate transport system substrate-binding protein